MSPHPGDRVRVERADVTNEGILMPSSTSDHLVIKLDGGYNVGIDRADASIDLVTSDAYDIGGTQTDIGSSAGAGADTEADKTESDITSKSAASAVAFDESLPTVSLISTGGTIASTVDYRTGAVTAQFDAEDVLRAVPDLAGRANYRGRVVRNILSENMTPAVWQDLAAAVADEIRAGADGVVVMHGTDTMQYSASALSYMLDTPVPVVFTGSQRSADRPSSDNVMNAVCAVEAATADISGVFVCMHASTADDTCALHRGTRVRKNHTSRRDAFKTVGATPIGKIEYDTETVSFHRDHAARESTELNLTSELNEDVMLLTFTPGMNIDRQTAFLTDSTPDGLIIAGTGLGHVHTEFIPTVAELVADGVVVAMTSQCIEGRVCDRVYDTGRDLLEAGVVEAGDTLPGTAKVKLMWALANHPDPTNAMRKSLAGELQHRSVPWE
ncbi:Glu-tRNA(Gln) amidotransferase subunit GatD [Haloquadratum walsbyi]|uniref:Glutamyl-tRNA(Gln) amidotransferase subunit D n=1 Tax=Haloquadratum walsbyi (strain DSM 16790 / HBSQ001) TaxID=362976 RepID=GATD_HALWD|nr:Glu-tRNA(Gln) amidotransferase subunit GatD [Haloquadratum walsbyi]Q18GL3.1 RecName: Full=Glutamyl-tRNA(Gln) amidotransferase subunit D; Short=Glu-ADT subunit D [Haloquadratum walsbyi DSM 16790]CAJ52884.1 glutamyl-tRNA(Gln) amidotransferase subunit D [Haloquadratum walsbyi DSM 16790]